MITPIRSSRLTRPPATTIAMRASFSVAGPVCLCSAAAALHVRRVKNGKPSVHPLRGDEIRSLRELRRQFPDSGFAFATERGGSFTADAVNRLIKRIGERARMPFQVHAHMLRQGCGYALANAGHDTRAIQDWLKHRSIQHTVRYTELSPTRFKDFWRN